MKKYTFLHSFFKIMSMFTQYTLAFLKPNDFLRGKPKKWRLAFENNNKVLKTETTIQLSAVVVGREGGG